MRTRYTITLVWTLIILVPDQITKWLTVEHFQLWESREVIPGLFNLTYVRNLGSAFGFLNSSDILWQTGFFVTVTLIAIGFMLYLLHVEGKSRLLSTGLGLIMGGALGNLLDRISHRYVIDFLDFYVGDWHWPAFNVADCGITVGAGLVILAYVLGGKDASDAA